MRLARLLPLIFLFGTCAHAITRVQHLFGTGGSSTSLAFGSNNTAGNTLVVIEAQTGNSAPFNNVATISDTQGNTYYSLGSQQTSNASSVFWFAPNCKAGANTVTTSVGPSPSQVIEIIEYSGLLVPYALEPSSSSLTQTGTSPISLSTTTVASADLLVSWAYREFQTGGSWGATAGWGIVDQGTSNGQFTSYDEFPVTAGTYPNAISITGGIRSLEGGIVAFRSVEPTSGILQLYNYGGANSYPTSSFVQNTTAGDMLICMWTGQGASAGTNMSISDSQTNTWVISNYLDESGINHNVLYVAYALNTAGGADTITLSGGFASAANQDILIELDSSKVGPEPYFSSATYGSISGTSQILPPIGQDGHELIIAVAGDYVTSQTFTTPSGFTTEFFGGTTSNYTWKVMTNYNPGAGIISPTTTLGLSPNTFGGAMLAFRTNSPPSPGRYQALPYVSAASATFSHSTLAGDVLMAFCNGGTGGVTDTQGNTWTLTALQGWQEGGNNTGIYSTKNIVGGSDTVTCASGAGIAIVEYRGVNTAQPVGQASGFTTWNNLSSFSTNQVTATANSILFSYGSLLNSTGLVFTPSSGFLSGPGSGRSTSFQIWDQVVASGNYSNTITASSGNIYGNAGLLVLSSSQITYPVVRQSSAASGLCCIDGSFTAAMAPVKLGNLILAFEAEQNGGTPTAPSDTQGNTYHYIIGSQALGYAVYYTFTSNSGALSVTGNPVSCISPVEIDNSSGLTLDKTATTAQTTASTISSGSVTTTLPNEFVVSVGYDQSAVGSQRTYYGSQSAPWSGLVFACGSSHSALWVGSQTQAAAGSYSNTFTLGASMTVAGGIFSFSTPGTSNTQPVVNIISEVLKPKIFVPYLPTLVTLSTKQPGFKRSDR